MTDASPIAPNINAPDLPPVAVEATPPITAEVGGGDSISKTTSSIPSSTVHREEWRNKSGMHFKWHADVLVDGHAVYFGFVRNISMKGADLFLDQNLQNIKLIKLHIHVPTLIATSPPHVMEVSASVVSTVYDSTESNFRYSVIFQQFTQASDQAHLRSRLDQAL
jgi:hypothetical protein